MIYTITANPAIDLVIKIDQLIPGTLNRSTTEEYIAGGKGVNVSVLLKRLGHENIATGFIGGFTGQFIQQELEKESIKTNFIEVDANTRINVKVKGAEETEINAAGPFISKDKMDELLTYLKSILKNDDVVFLSGNAAPGMEEYDYQAIASTVKSANARLVLDTNRNYLKACLNNEPFLIKPNQDELGEIFDKKIESEDEIIKYAKKLQDLGARNVIVSRGGDGALLLNEEGEIYLSNVPNGKVVNSVGAGDSMLAGFMAALIEGKDWSEALLLGAAAGSATAYSTGIANASFIDDLMKEIKVVKIN